MVRQKNRQVRHIIAYANGAAAAGCEYRNGVVVGVNGVNGVNGGGGGGRSPSPTPPPLHPPRSRKSSNPSRIYCCPHCSAFFHDKNNAKRHVQVNHNLLPVRHCNHLGCNFQSQSFGELARHQSEHPAEPKPDDDEEEADQQPNDHDHDDDDEEVAGIGQALTPTWAFMSKYL